MTKYQKFKFVCLAG